MTTYRRELRQAILKFVLESSMFYGASARWQEYDLMSTGACKAEAEEFSDRLADAILPLLDKKPEKPDRNECWQSVSG